MALTERDMLHLKSEFYDETLAQTYGKPIVLELFNALSAAQEEIKQCDKYAKEQYKAYDEKIETLEHQNQKLRTCLELIVNTPCVCKHNVTAKQALEAEGE